MFAKDELRGAMRARLRGVDPAERARASEAICAALRNDPRWQNARMVCAFLPLPREPAIAALWEAEPARAICFPRVRGEVLELVRIDDRALLELATWRLDDAAFACLPLVAPTAIDLFLVPGLAFTREGGRLGRGRGHYDRLLAQTPARKIGVCFELQIVDELPLEAHDQRVERVVTESRGA